MKKQNLFLVSLSVFLLCLAACGQKESQSGKGMKIVTSFYPIYAMVKEVSGDLNDVRMIQSSSGIHSSNLQQMILQPSMMQMSLSTIRIHLNLGREVWIPI